MLFSCGNVNRKIADQVEYLLSREYLEEDPHLKGSVDAEGYVKIGDIASHVQVKKLYENPGVVLEALQERPLKFKVHKDGTRVRLKDSLAKNYLVLRGPSEETPLSEIKSIFNPGLAAKIARIDFVHHNVCYVYFYEDDSAAQEAIQYVCESVPHFKGNVVTARAKTLNAFVSQNDLYADLTPDQTLPSFNASTENLLENLQHPSLPLTGLSYNPQEDLITSIPPALAHFESCEFSGLTHNFVPAMIPGNETIGALPPHLMQQVPVTYLGHEPTEHPFMNPHLLPIIPIPAVPQTGSGFQIGSAFPFDPDCVPFQPAGEPKPFVNASFAPNWFGLSSDIRSLYDSRSSSNNFLHQGDTAFRRVQGMDESFSYQPRQYTFNPKMPSSKRDSNKSRPSPRFSGKKSSSQDRPVPVKSSSSRTSEWNKVKDSMDASAKSTESVSEDKDPLVEDFKKKLNMEKDSTCQIGPRSKPHLLDSTKQTSPVPLDCASSEMLMLEPSIFPPDFFQYTPAKLGKMRFLCDNCRRSMIARPGSRNNTKIKFKTISMIEKEEEGAKAGRLLSPIREENNSPASSARTLILSSCPNPEVSVLNKHVQTTVGTPTLIHASTNTETLNWGWGGDATSCSKTSGAFLEPLSSNLLVSSGKSEESHNAPFNPTNPQGWMEKRGNMRPQSPVWNIITSNNNTNSSNVLPILSYAAAAQTFFPGRIPANQDTGHSET